MRFWLALAYCDVDEHLDLARTADACGYHGVTISDHLFTPREMRASYPYTPDGTPPFGPDTPWPDVWVAIGAMAAVTERVRFTTNIYVPVVREVFTVAKAVSTAATIARGRVAAGFGAGWCSDEFEQTGQDFATRGQRLDETIVALRRLWTGDWVSFDGRHVTFPEVKISPVPSAPIPVYVGGHSSAAVRRAATLGDGWMGAAYPPPDAEAKLAAVRSAVRDAGRDPDTFETVCAVMAWPKPDLFARFADLGLTGTLCAPHLLTEDQTPSGRRAAVERFAEEVVARSG